MDSMPQNNVRLSPRVFEGYNQIYVAGPQDGAILKCSLKNGVPEYEVSIINYNGDDMTRGVIPECPVHVATYRWDGKNKIPHEPIGIEKVMCKSDGLFRFVFESVHVATDKERVHVFDRRTL